MVRNILLFGPQGSGKGTQGEKLNQWLKLPLVVTGNIFRTNIKNNTDLGKLAQQYIQQGQLVPDEVTNAMIKDRLAQTDCAQGYVLDGFPRSLIQAQALETFSHVTDLLHITLSDSEAVLRIAQRRTCAQGHVYHLTYNPARQAGVCDVDSTALVQREDDTEAALKTRLSIYHSETEPLLEFYRSKGVVHDIDGALPIAEVWKNIQAFFV